MEETKKKEKKGSFIKKLKSLLALVLVVVVSVLGTLAYLQNKTGPVQNTFTGSDDIDLKVIEPNWEENPGWEDKNHDGKIDDYDKDLITNQWVDLVDPDDQYNTNDTKEGENLAESYTPGLEIPKDPQLENTTGKDYSEWVAIRVDYYIDKTPTKYANFAKNSTNTIDKEVIEEIDFNLQAADIIRTGDDDGGYWIKIEPTDADATYELYVYSVPLANGKVTEPLFEQIQINSKIKKRTYITKEDNSNTDDSEEETAVKYPSVNIFITGGAIKVEAIHTDELNLTSLEIQGGGSPTTEQAKANTEINAIKGALKEILEKDDVDDTFVSSCSWPTGCIKEKQ